MPLSCFCYFSSFLPTDPTGQLTAADTCEVTSFCSFGKKAVAVLHAQTVTEKKSGVGRSDLSCSLARHMLLVISARSAGSLCYQCHPLPNTLSSSSIKFPQSPALLL